MNDMKALAKIAIGAIASGIVGVIAGIIGALILVWLLCWWLGWTIGAPDMGALDLQIIGAAASLASGFIVIIVAYKTIESHKAIANRADELRKANAISDIPLAMQDLINVCSGCEVIIKGYNQFIHDRMPPLNDLSLAAIHLIIEHTQGKCRDELRKILFYYECIKIQFLRCANERSNMAKSQPDNIETEYSSEQQKLIKMVISLRSIAEAYGDFAKNERNDFCIKIAQDKYKDYTKEFNKFPFKKDIDFDYDYDNDDIDTGFLNPRYIENNIGKSR